MFCIRFLFCLSFSHLLIFFSHFTGKEVLNSRDLIINPPPPPPKLIPSESYLDKKDALELDALGSKSSHIHSEFSYSANSSKNSYRQGSQGYRSSQSTPMSIESGYSYGSGSFSFINKLSNAGLSQKSATLTLTLSISLSLSLSFSFSFSFCVWPFSLDYVG